ncbi:MAG: AAA family ATPase [candidate division WOR-3 bacterium]
MLINYLFLQNFRKFEKKEFFFKEGVNLITGPNGAGKTTILEAVHLLSYPRNLKGASNSEIIKKGKEFSLIFCKGNSKNGKYEIKLEIEKDKKNLYFNNKKVPSYSYVFKKLPTIFFHSKKEIIFWNKSELFREINYLFSLLDNEYFKILLNYNRILEQRNKYLKNIKENIDPFKKLLQDNGKILQSKRIIYIKKIEEVMKNYLNVFINYEPSVLEYDFEKEKEKGFTLFGISRDKITFLKDGFELKTQCSEGEKRIFLFYFYIAIAEMMKESGNLPLLLLDDPFSILDFNLVKDFIGKWEGQIIITSLKDLDIKNKIVL